MKLTLKVRDQKPGEFCRDSQLTISENMIKQIVRNVVLEWPYGDTLVMMTISIDAMAWCVIPDPPKPVAVPATPETSAEPAPEPP